MFVAMANPEYTKYRNHEPKPNMSAPRAIQEAAHARDRRLELAARRFVEQQAEERAKRRL